MITAAVMLTAIVTVALYTVNTANAQGNATSSGGANMTKAGGAIKNATGAAGNTTKNMVGGPFNKTK